MANEKTAATKCSRSLKRTAQRRAVTVTLTKKGIPFTDGTRVCKSAKVPTPFTRKIRKLKSWCRGNDVHGGDHGTGRVVLL